MSENSPTQTGTPCRRAKSAAVADALSTAALSMEAAEIERACAELGARVTVAHDQEKAMDLFRDPLKWIGPPIGD